MDNNNDLIDKVSGWLRQYGLCPGEQGGNGWTEVYYDGVLFEYGVMDDKVCFTVSAQIPDGDMEDRAKAAFELMENSESVQIYLEEIEDDSDEEGIILRVWVHELSDYGRFVQEFRFKMDQCVACYLKICGMPVFNGETEEEEENCDSNVEDEGLKERMRQIEAYLKEKEIEYEVIDQSSVTVLADEASRVIIDISDGWIALSTLMDFPKEMRDALAHAAFSTMHQIVGQWIVREEDDCTGVLYDVELRYYEDDDEQAFVDKLAYLLIAYVDSTDVFAGILQSHSERTENVPESAARKEEDADVVDTGRDENVRNKVVTALREAGYSPAVEDGIHFQWQGSQYLVLCGDVWTAIGMGMYLPKDIGDFQALPSYLFEVMSQSMIKLSIEEEDCDDDRWAVGISVEIPNSDLSGEFINPCLLVMQEVCGALLEHFGLCADDEDEEKSAAVCDSVFNCLSEGGYCPEDTGREDGVVGHFRIEYGGYDCWVFVCPAEGIAHISIPLWNESGYEFGKEVRAAFSLMAHNTDVTVTHREPDEDECEIFCLSETLMLSDDKEKFLSDLKLCLEDLDRCTDFFIEQVKQQ